MFFEKSKEFPRNLTITIYEENIIMTNFNKTADCIAVPDKVSDAEKLIVNGKDITKDKTAKIICSDPNFLGRSVKLKLSLFNISDLIAASRYCESSFIY